MNPLKAFYRSRAEEIVRRRGKLPRTPSPKTPKALARSYLRELQPRVDFVNDLIKRVLIPALPAIMDRHASRKDELREDDTATEVVQLIEQLRVLYQRRYTKAEAEALAAQYANRVKAFSAEQIQEQFRRVLGVDAIAVSPAIEDAVRVSVAENAELITSIPEQYLTQVQREVFDAVRSGTSTAELADLLEDRYNVASSRAALIARDQISKMNGALTEVTQRAVGITGYVWRTARDARVRDSHAALEGKSFDWNDPPSVGHPGQDYNCRCDAEPDFSGLLPDE